MTVRTHASFLRRHPVLTVFFIALVARLLAIYVIATRFNNSITVDDKLFNFLAASMAEGDTESWDSFTHWLYWHTATFLIPVTGIYKAVGSTLVTGQAYVAILGAAVAALTTRLALEILEVRWALLGGLLIALLPSQIMWSSVLLKDSSVWILLVAIALLVAIGNRSSGKKLIIAGVGIALCLALLGFARQHTTVIAAWAIVPAAFFGISSDRIQRIAGTIVIAVAIPYFVGLGPAGLTFVTTAGSLEELRLKNAQGANTAFVEAGEESDGVDNTSEALAAAEELKKEARNFQLNTKQLIARLKKRVRRMASLVENERARLLLERTSADLRHSSSTLQKNAMTLNEAIALLQESTLALKSAKELIESSPQFESSSPLHPNLAHLPRGLIAMLFEPTPWSRGGSFGLKMARLESVLWYSMLALALLGISVALRHKRVLAFPLMSAIGILLVYALTEGNLGTAYRHRGEFVWTVATLAAVGISWLATRRRGGVSIIGDTQASGRDAA